MQSQNTATQLLILRTIEHLSSQNMPLPGTPGAPRFNGKNVCDFIDVFKSAATRAKLSNEQIYDELPAYVDRWYRNEVRELEPFKEGREDFQAQKAYDAMLDAFEDQDHFLATMSPAYLKKLLKEERRTPADYSLFIRRYSVVAKNLIREDRLGKSEAIKDFIKGLPEAVGRRLVAHFKIGKSRAKVPRFEDLVTAARDQLEVRRQGDLIFREDISDLDDIFEEETKALMPRRSKAKGGQIASTSSGQISNESPIDSLTKALEAMSLNLLQMNTDRTKKPISSKPSNRFTEFTEDSADEIYGPLEVNAYGGRKANCYWCFNRAPSPFDKQEAHYQNDCEWKRDMIERGYCHYTDFGILCTGPKRSEGIPYFSPNKETPIGAGIMTKVKGTRWDPEASTDISKREGNTSKSIPINTIEIGFTFDVNNTADVNAVGRPKLTEGKAKSSDKSTPKTILKRPAPKVGFESLDDRLADFQRKVGTTSATQTLEGQYKLVDNTTNRQEDSAETNQPFEKITNEEMILDDDIEEIVLAPEKRRTPRTKKEAYIKIFADSTANELFHEIINLTLGVKVSSLVSLIPELQELFGRRVPVTSKEEKEAIRAKLAELVEGRNIDKTLLVNHLTNVFEHINNSNASIPGGIEPLIMGINSLDASTWPNRIKRSIRETPKMAVKMGDNKLPSTAVLDSGAMCNTMLEEVARNAGLIIQTDKHFTMRGPDGAVSSFEGLCTDVSVFCGNIETIADFFIMRTGSNPILLGQPWFFDTEGTFDYFKGDQFFSFIGADGKTSGRARVCVGVPDLE